MDMMREGCNVVNTSSIRPSKRINILKSNIIHAF